MNRTKIRRILTLISLLLFPITLNFFSPYVSIDGAFNGIISGSVIVFILLFLSGLLFRRAWCSYVCPVAALSEYTEKINGKSVNRKRLRIIRYSIFALWFITLVSGFIIAGGIKGIDPFHLTENGISVDMPLKYVTYYLVLGSLFILTLTIGKRGACHSICWMSPFMVAGAWVGDKLNLPQFKIVSDHSKCIHCSQCDKVCPMSISVMKDQEDGWIKTQDCILCGQCVDACPKKILSIKCQKRKTK
jgi:polyferredoxin